MNKDIVSAVTTYILENEEKQEYLFQYAIKVTYNPDIINPGTIKKKLEWVKDRYREILDICFYEARTFREQSFNVSREEFMETIEPVTLDFYSIEHPTNAILTFKLGGILEGKLITVEVTDSDEIGSVLMRT